MKIECKLNRLLQYREIQPGEVFQRAWMDAEPTIYMATAKKDEEGDRYCVDLETGECELLQSYVPILNLRAKVVVEGREEGTDEGTNQAGD